MTIRRGYMRLCKYCRGSGTLFRPKPGRPIRDSFKRCPQCSGRGVQKVKKSVYKQ